MELLQGLCGLREETYIATEIKAGNIRGIGQHNGVTLRLPHETKHLSMAGLTEDDYLRIRIVLILSTYATLQLQHHRAGGINYLYTVSLSRSIGGRRLAMGTKQHLATPKRTQLLMVYGLQSQRAKPLTLLTVVHNVTKAVEAIAPLQLFLSLAYGSGHSKAKA